MTMKNTGIGLIYFVVEGGGITKYWTLLGAARHQLFLHNISIYIHLILYLEVFYYLKKAYRKYYCTY